MGRLTTYISLLFLVAILFGGCSTTKNTAISRGYHNLTSHYNVLFNAKESVKWGLLQIDETVQDEYTKVLPLFKYSNTQSANAASSDMELAILKCSKLIAVHSITEKPKRRSNPSEQYKEFASKSEFNKWVDDSYLLMGQAYLYMHNYHKAIENFSFLIRKFNNEPIKYDAYIWLAKAYITDERYKNAEEVFEILDSDPWFPKKQKKQLELVKAFYYINQNQYRDAVPYLEESLMYNFPGKEDARYTYVLAQLYVETDRPVLADRRFREVLKKRPSYVLAFNARLSRASLFTGNNDAEDLKKQLKKMLRDKKNVDFQDRIYYALGNVAMKEGLKEDALNYYKISAASSTKNTDQRALSCLTLARSYYTDEEYVNSQLYYDSTLVIINSDYAGYQEISTRASSLSRLVENITIIELEDSLQNLAVMPERERNKLFNKWIKEARQEEARQREIEQAQDAMPGYGRSRAGINSNMTGNSKSWYFYNPTTVGIGKSDFRRTWGKRRLEDNWRRANKASTSIDEPLAYLETTETDTIKIVKKERIEDPKTIEYYTQDLPVNDSLMELSDERLLAAFNKLSGIYESEFNDFNRSIETLEEMNSRFPGSMFELPSWYQLYKLNKVVEDDQKANYYRNKIISDYADSKYASFLQNPNYFIELQAKKSAINNLYKNAFKNYSLRNFNEAEKVALNILALKPDSTILPKIKFIEIISRGTSLDATTFSKLLESYIEKFPGSEPYGLAVSILDRIKDESLSNMHELLASGYINSTIVNKEILDIERAMNDEFDGKFSYDEDIFHYFVIALPKNVKTDINRLIFDIANYNLDYYSTYDFDIEKVDLNKNSEFIVIRSLPNKEEGLIYFRSIIRKRPVFATLDGVEYFNFTASSKNYREILANQDYREYLKFFMKNYSHFIGSDFPTNNLPDPMELLAEVQKEDIPVEKGEYVKVFHGKQFADYIKNMEEEQMNYAEVSSGSQKLNAASQTSAVSSYRGPFKSEQGTNYSFAIIAPSNGPDFKQLQQLFEEFNSSNFGSPLIQTRIESFDDSRKILLVSGLDKKTSALTYFRKVIANRTLYSPIENYNFRNFIISRENTEILRSERNLQEYTQFFSKFYLNK